MTTTMAEPEWDEDTRNLVLAHAAVDLCPLCKNPASICQSADNQFAFQAGAPIRCHVTTARHIAQRGAGDDPAAPASALLWPVVFAGGGQT